MIRTWPAQDRSGKVARTGGRARKGMPRIRISNVTSTISVITPGAGAKPTHNGSMRRESSFGSGTGPSGDKKPKRSQRPR